MKLPDFSYFSPTGWEECQELMIRYSPDNNGGAGNQNLLSSIGYRFLAGGTDLIAHLKRGEERVSALISLKKMADLQEVSLIEGALLVGSTVRLSDLMDHPLVRKHLPLLSKVISEVASPQIRFQATIGGNLLANNRCKFVNQEATNRECHEPCFKAGGESCHLIPNATLQSHPICRARFISDLAPLLMVLGAHLRFRNSLGQEHRVPIRSFYPHEGLLAVKTRECLVGIEIPLAPQNQKLDYVKLRIRQTLDFPSLGMALAVAGAVGSRKLAICLTGVDVAPVLVEVNESEGENFAARATELARKSVMPIKQDFFSPKYRKEMIGVFINRFFKTHVELA